MGTKPKGVEILGMKVVLFRGTDGKIRCINDVCPHRGAPLHMGWVSEVCLPALFTAHCVGPNFNLQLFVQGVVGSSRPLFQVPLLLADCDRDLRLSAGPWKQRLWIGR